MKNVIQKKFVALHDCKLHIDQKTLAKKFERKSQDTPFPFPHADSLMYGRSMYVVGQSGLWQADCNKRNVYPVSRKPGRIWDAPVLAVSGNYGSLALSAGREGLWEVDLGWSEYRQPKKAKNISKRPCIDCEWLYYSIFASSYDDSGYLASFSNELEHVKKNSEDDDDIDDLHSSVGQGPRKRIFEGEIDSSQIFKKLGHYSWGVKDKVYSGGNKKISVSSYNPWDKYGNAIQQVGTYELEHAGSIVSAGVASFGVVIEYDDAIVVLPSKGKAVMLRGEPVNWRVFPKSLHYQNHLHVIYGDHIAIYSFNHDYFVDQKNKIYGSRPETNELYRPRIPQTRQNIQL